MTYSVHVGNIGCTGTLNTLRAARSEFAHYVSLSRRGIGRAAGEDVLIVDRSGEIIAEYIAPENK